jgi:hypothetical protein
MSATARLKSLSPLKTALLLGTVGTFVTLCMNDSATCMERMIGVFCEPVINNTEETRHYCGCPSHSVATTSHVTL